jgi:capsular exopolysaccharide synthesis family protein
VTFHSALAALRSRWWIVLLTVIASFGAGALYQLLSPTMYSSAATVRLNASVSAAVADGSIAGIPVDVDPTLIGSRAVLEPAAEQIGDDFGELQAAVSWATLESEFATIQVDVEAEADTPVHSQERVVAVVDSYDRYISAQLAAARTTIDDQLAAARQSATDAQAQLQSDPGNTVLISTLSDALAQISTLNGQVAALGAVGSPVTSLVEAAPGTPDGPGALTVAALTLLSGLIVGGALALLFDFFDDRVRRETDLSTLTGQPNLGSLGFDRQADRNENRLPAAASQRSPIEEAIRALRTTLQVMLPPGGASIVVTSVAPGDGKSFVAANLAVAWARLGKRVILVDGDFRRPNVATYFPELAAGPGISDLVRAAPGDAVDADAVTAVLAQTRQPGLWVLPAGRSLADPADLLGRPAFAAVVKQLTDRADFVIFDSPPSLGLTDAALMGAHTDGVVLILTDRRTRRRHLQETIAALHRQGAKILGTVTNRARDRVPGAYASYYYNTDAAAAAHDPLPPVSEGDASRTVSRRTRRTARPT